MPTTRMLPASTRWPSTSMSRTASAVWPRPEVTYANGDREVMYFNDFNSGTTIQNVVHPAKKNAITSVPATGQPGLRIQHLPRFDRRRVRRERSRPPPPIPMTGHGSRARRASGSSTSARWITFDLKRGAGHRHRVEVGQYL